MPILSSRTLPPARFARQHPGPRISLGAVGVASLLLAACSSEPPIDPETTSSQPATTATVQLIDPPGGPGAMAPNLSAAPHGATLTWLEPLGDGAGHGLYLSELRGHEWTPARQIASGDAFFANWADVPAVATAEDGARFAHWLGKLGEDTYAYGVSLAQSQDDGETWQELGLLHDDASPTEHGFVSYAPLPGGGVQAFWLDGRAMPDGGGMQLRTTRLGDPAHLGDPSPLASTVLDDRVCECCATDAATTTDGPVVVYRDRGPTEVRDLAIVRKTADGWSKPAMIHDDGWQIHGCPVNGPAIAADGYRVAVAWFSASGSQPQVAVAFSGDGGASFTPPRVVDDAQPLGRVDVALDPRGGAFVSWMGSSGDKAQIRWRRVALGGETGPEHLVAATLANRSAGVPRMLHSDDQLLFAWVEATEPSRVRAGYVALR